VTIGCDVVQHVLDRLAKLRKGCVVAIACHFALQKLPEPLDWLFILHLDCVVRRNDCTISAKPTILYGYTELPMVVLSNPIDRISPGFDLRPQLGLTHIQYLAGLTDTQAARWRYRLHQTCHVLIRQAYPNRAGARLLFARHDSFACPKHDRVWTCAE